MTTYSLTSPVPEAQNVGAGEQAVDTVGMKPVCTDGVNTHCFGCFGLSTVYVHYVNSTGEASAQLWSHTGNGSAGVRNAAYNPINNKMYIGGSFLLEIDLNESPSTFTVVQGDLGVSNGGMGTGFGISKGGLVFYTAYSPFRNFYIFDPNPALEPPDNWKDYGNPHDAGDYQYVRVGVDNTYIYFACRSDADPVVDSLYYCPIAGTVNWQGWPYNGAGDLAVEPFSPNGTTDVYIYRKLANETEKFYTFNGATFTEVSDPGWYSPTGHPLNCIPDASAAAYEGQELWGWYFDFSALSPIKVVWEYSMMSWNDGVDYYQSQIAFNAGFEDNYINAAIGVGGANFLGLGIGYSAAVNFNPAAAEGSRTTYIGAEVQSPYTIKRHPTSGEIYAAGYSNKVWRFTPDSPLTAGNWTLNPTYYAQTFGPSDDPKPNPYFINLGSTVLHYRLFIDFDAAGLVWIGGNTTRLSPDYGDVMWYNPATGTSGYVFPSWEDTYQVRDLCAANNRSIICVSNDNGQIYLIDAATQTPDGTPYVPVVGGTGSIWMIEAAPDVVLGIYVHYDTSTYKVFTFQPSTKTTIMSPQNFGVSDTVPFGWEDAGANNRRYFKLELGPDGYVWMFVDATIYRINPATCEFESVVTMPTTGKLKFASNNTDLLVYFNEPSGTENYYIPGILTGSSEPASPILSIGGSMLTIGGKLLRVTAGA